MTARGMQRLKKRRNEMGGWNKIMKLWYESEAKEWTQALPLGNGHMGAMCYGGADGRYDLSENTCWFYREIIQKARFCWKTVQEKRSIMVRRFRWGD